MSFSRAAYSPAYKLTSRPFLVLYFLEAYAFVWLIRYMVGASICWVKLEFYIVIILASSVLPFLSVADEINLTLEDAKVHYTFEIVKHVKWPKDAALEQLKVGLLEVDENLARAFNKKRGSLIRGKSFVFERLKDKLFDPNAYDLIYLSSKKRSSMRKLLAESETTLIIADGKVDKEHLMISLLSSRNKIRIKLNRDNLAPRGFEISNNLLALAGSKEDLSDQLHDNAQELERLLLQVEEKQKKLDALNMDLAQRELNLKVAEDKIRASKKDLGEQRILLQEKQNEIAEKAILVSELQQSIDANQVILDKQQEKITSQSSTIEEQRGWMLTITGVSCIFFVMIYGLWRTNSLRKRANKKLAQLNSRLYELATTDGMTKLFNRRHFLESAQKEMKRQQRNNVQAIILMMDIDHFKSVNDRHGHAMGDEVIKRVAGVFSKGLRPYDIVGRIGGEEYAMMLIECDISLGQDIAQRLCNEVARQDVSHGGASIKVTISIGLSILKQEDTKIEQALTRADRALYKAKESGRNRVVSYI